VRVLVVIANHGSRNDGFARRLLDEYRSMSFAVDLVVLSNVPKDYGRDVEVRVGMPSPDPWSLPFAHKAVMAERADAYDLFVYSEDDTLIRQRNLEAFLGTCDALDEDEIAGFLRAEVGPDGAVSLSTVHSHYHWVPSSVCARGPYTMAHFTNEHSGCFALTRKQLARALASGGFLVEPHQGRYDLPCSAATDPYTRCGLRKLLCVSHLDDFVVRHLSDRYVGRLGLERADLERQIGALRKVAAGQAPSGELLCSETRLPRGRWSKSYYEPASPSLLALVPDAARTLLSVGCGSAEQSLQDRGARVAAIPLDAVIGACAAARGLEILPPDLDAALAALGSRRFDCVLASQLLHLAPDPVAWLRRLSQVLEPGGALVASLPNLDQLAVRWHRWRARPGFSRLLDPAASGLHATSEAVARSWLERCGLAVAELRHEIPPRFAGAQRASLGLWPGLWSAGFAFRAERAGGPAPAA
jgi:SAM-dependent methyltransferase